LKYSNPLPPEGINTTQTHPLKELLLLTGGLIGLVAAAVIIIGVMAEHLAEYIPFETERTISQPMSTEVKGGAAEVQAYLQELADDLAKAQSLPQEMSITVHYVENDTVNAMASLGGHVVIFQGLLQKLESDNAIAMVLAHEIAHIQHRHPIQALGRGAMVTLAMAAIGLTTGDPGNILGSAGLLTALTFNRSQEQQSDFTALHSLFGHYGHINGATDLFQVLLKEESNFVPSATFFSSHPLSENRIQNIIDYAHQRDWPTTGKLTPVPINIHKLISVKREHSHSL